MTNAGPSDASGVAIDNVLTLPVGVTVNSVTESTGTFSDPKWTIGNLTSGTSQTRTIVLTVDATTGHGAVITNTASGLVANETLVNTSDDSATETTSVVVVDKIGVSRGGNQFFFDIDGDFVFGGSDQASFFGMPGDTPVIGDWNGDGRDEIGVNRGGNRWYLDSDGNSVFDAGDQAIVFGLPGDVPVIGDWNGDGTDDLGIQRGRRFLFDSNGDDVFTAGDLDFIFGLTGDVTVIGDWNGDGRDEIGVNRGGNLWHLDSDGNNVFDAGDQTIVFGLPGDVPVIGDWNGDGTDDFGVRRDHFFYLDSDGSGVFDTGDQSIAFGMSGDVPIVGKWRDAAALPFARSFVSADSSPLARAEFVTHAPAVLRAFESERQVDSQAIRLKQSTLRLPIESASVVLPFWGTSNGPDTEWSPVPAVDFERELDDLFAKFDELDEGLLLASGSVPDSGRRHRISNRLDCGRTENCHISTSITGATDTDRRRVYVLQQPTKSIF